MKGAHSRYAGFVAYGDADAYVKEVKLLRQQLQDMIDKESYYNDNVIWRTFFSFVTVFLVIIAAQSG